MTTKALWVVAAVALLSACAQTPRETAPPSAASTASLAVRMEYRQNDEAGSNVSWTRETRFWMGLVRGDIFGNPSVTLHEETGNLHQLTLDLSALAAVADKYAEPLTPMALTRGFRLEPTQARVARVGSFTYDALSGTAIGATGFIAPADDKLLLLIYADRPCRLHGFIPLPNSESTDVDVQLPAAGFHWLRIDDDDPKLAHLVLIPALTAVTHRTRIKSQ
jgi:hypothetical protein